MAEKTTSLIYKSCFVDFQAQVSLKLSAHIPLTRCRRSRFFNIEVVFKTDVVYFRSIFFAPH